ncbi:dicarboxylate/amino acid:cation symporter [Epilithonimonas ginsengisoli]|uniref:Dicarboxylate/amino acid:cation symporter n=1 Tax=Epilithonimonas ginsengisoli TaxID=1245592 RepID=A0ABU4JMQ8_9FLAO|nr:MULTISPECIES: dicarboxylate/amino acid:cation symporter [Chryseobacterium group]MBV6881908.1 dicarboxylate/amino acid:cation symporter [Epilithonimonas sp. FP105]MDW8550977.1 dicarboxylate/amino acid:cation symporter [Epilithonimonas ginsengisoli]OAH66677.1 sodium:proton antiporter [Chryseobacterium sp. FP211-J200]
MKSSFWTNYSNIILLLIGIFIGSLVGIFMPDFVVYLKPIGDIFLNLLFVTVIPLVFFAIVSAISGIEQQNQLGKIIGTMVLTFLSFILISATFCIILVYFFPTEAPKNISEAITENLQSDTNINDQIVGFFTVSEFYHLFSRQNMLALLVFSFLVGISIRKSGEMGKAFQNFILSGNEVMKQLLLLIMKVAPVGLGAYFAYQVGTIGPQLFGFYAKPLGLYYIAGTIYFIVFFSLYAFVWKGGKGVKAFWKESLLPTATAISTCSSLATMPVAIESAKRMGVPASIANVVIPIGTTIHKNGSSISSIIKIYVAFQLLGWNLFEPMNLIMALGITVFVSAVAGGIPNGGYIGEMLMISVYKIPPDVVPAVIIIGTLVDPLATVLNSVGNILASMIVSKFVKVES